MPRFSRAERWVHRVLGLLMGACLVSGFVLYYGPVSLAVGNRHAVELGRGQPVDEQRRKQDVVAEPLGLRPERLGQERGPAESASEGDQQRDRRQRQEDGAGHRLRASRGAPGAAARWLVTSHRNREPA